MEETPIVIIPNKYLPLISDNIKAKSFKSMFNRMNMNGKPASKFGKLSGSEPKYEPGKWNENDKIRRFHNCYSYSINEIEKRTGKAQPGYFSGFPPLDIKDYNCSNFLKRLKHDMPSMYVETFKNKCKKGFHKAFLAIDNTGDYDYHFYRQDDNNYWSHKPGASYATNLDASGEKITNPYTADREYPHYNYSIPCFYFCVNPKFARTYSKANK